MYTLDEMCTLSMRIFFNSLTYQANKLLEKVNVNLYCSYFDIGQWNIGNPGTVEEVIFFFDYVVICFILFSRLLLAWSWLQVLLSVLDQEYLAYLSQCSARYFSSRLRHQDFENIIVILRFSNLQTLNMIAC